MLEPYKPSSALRCATLSCPADVAVVGVVLTAQQPEQCLRHVSKSTAGQLTAGQEPFPYCKQALPSRQRVPYVSPALASVPSLPGLQLCEASEEVELRFV